MKVRKLIDSFNYAIDGIIYALRTQRNMRIHFIVALIILSACFVYDISKIELIILAITITMVIAAELVNTAIESAIDLSTNYYHPLAKVAKNTAAGAVLITAINAVLVGYIIFWDELTNITFRIMDRVKETEPYIYCISHSMHSCGCCKGLFWRRNPIKGWNAFRTQCYSLFYSYGYITYK